MHWQYFFRVNGVKSNKYFCNSYHEMRQLVKLQLIEFHVALWEIEPYHQVFANTLQNKEEKYKVFF